MTRRGDPGVVQETTSPPPAAGHASDGAARPWARWVLPVRIAAAAIGGLALFAAFPPLGWWPCAPWASPSSSAPCTAPAPGGRPGSATWPPPCSCCPPSPGCAPSATTCGSCWSPPSVSSTPPWPPWPRPCSGCGAGRCGSCGLWVLMEWARSLVPIGGFPWARVAFSQGETPYTPYAALGGVPLVSFAVTLSSRPAGAGRADPPSRPAVRVQPPGRLVVRAGRRARQGPSCGAGAARPRAHVRPAQAG